MCEQLMIDANVVPHQDADSALDSTVERVLGPYTLDSNSSGDVAEDLLFDPRLGDVATFKRIDDDNFATLVRDA